MRNKREQNLIPMNKQPPEVRKAMGRKGGIASGRAKREKKAMSEILRMMIDQPIDKANATIVSALKKVGISSEEATNGALINLQLMNLALSSSVDEKTKLRAIEMIHRFIDGQKVDVTTNGKEVTHEPLVIEVIDSREQVINEDDDEDEET